WSVHHQGKPIITPSEIGMVINGADNIAQKVTVTDAARRDVDEIIIPVVAQKSSRIREQFRELALRFDNDFGLELRAYNDGVAYRFVGARPGDIRVEREIMELNFPKGATTLFPEEETFISHFERSYVAETISAINKKRFGSLPTYMSIDGVSMVFTESDVTDYPGMFLYGTGKSGFRAGFPGVVTSATPAPGGEDRNQIIKSAKYIA